MSYASGQGWELLHGDCIEAMHGMAEASVDAIVCDPPAGIGFMGRGWDGNRGGRDQWIDWLAEVMTEGIRVLKPGAHALVWALPRTSHWTGMALEDAGFDVRDRITHLFGSGFPKSLDVSKAIDKAASAEREVIGRKADPRYLSPATETSGAPLGCIDPRPNSVENYERAGFITAPATPEAAAWTGWGTALKPGGEDWWLCRKPLAEGTVAANVTAWGTGGINVDGCRIGANPNYRYNADRNGTTFHGEQGERIRQSSQKKGAPVIESTGGRWPANCCLSHSPECEQVGTRRVRGSHLDHDCGGGHIFDRGEMHKRGHTDPDGTEEVEAWNCVESCAVRLLDEQAGVRRSAGHYPSANGCKTPGWGNIGTQQGQLYADTGGASRFFYTAKSSRSERGKGCTHPTVKPLALMRWLCRLITPPGGLILDPFTGSGSTGVAAIAEGFRFIGIEKEAEYCEMARERLAGVHPRLPGLDLP